MAQLTENALKLLQEKQYFQEGENTWEDICKRVSEALAEAETDEKKKKWVQQNIYKTMVNLDFIFSTPCLLNANKDNPGQLSSCFIHSIKDNIESICQLDAEFSKVFQKNGGSGASLGALRPVKSNVNTSKGYAGGPVAFMEKYDATAEIMTRNNPSRKGALKLNLPCWHPDIYEFIHVKDDITKLHRMNISVSITDEFMEAVKKDLDWDLVFPDYEAAKEYYDKEWDGNLEKWKRKGYPIKVYKTVMARDLYKEIAKCAWMTGEPGLNYQDRMNVDNKNKHLYDEVYTNPCNEFVNIPYSSCILGSINLSNCVENGEFNWEKLKWLTYNAVRWLDNMTTVNKLPLKKIDKVTKQIRAIGLGIMGLAEVFYKLNIRYNSQKGFSLAEEIIKTMREIALVATMELAEEKGVYPAWEGSEWWEHDIKVRNSNLLSIAPTGSISFIANTSGGCEPVFALAYTRKTYDGTLYYVINDIFKNELIKRGIYSEELIQKIIDNNGSCQGIDEIPKDIQEVFVVAHDIPPEDHVVMVSVLQKYVDLSVSKTVNLSHEATVEDVENVFMLAWKSGLKGITVYRDGSRADQTLSVKRDNKLQSQTTNFQVTFDSIAPINKEQLGETYGTNIKEKVACGNLYISLFRDDENNLSEMFINTSKGGICQSNTNAISRLVSLALRGGIKVEEICDQLIGIKCPACSILRSQGQQKVGMSCPDTIGKYILKKYKSGQLQNDDVIVVSNDNEEFSYTDNKMSCPNCGDEMRMEAGCQICNCGFSRCG